MKRADYASSMNGMLAQRRIKIRCWEFRSLHSFEPTCEIAHRLMLQRLAVAKGSIFPKESAASLLPQR